MRCCFILGAWLSPAFFGCLKSVAGESAVVDAAPVADGGSAVVGVEGLSHLCEPLLDGIGGEQQILSKDADIRDVGPHLVRFGVSLNDSDTSSNEGVSEYNESNLNDSESRIEDGQLNPPGNQPSMEIEIKKTMEKREIESQFTAEIGSRLPNRRMMAKAAFRAHQRGVYDLGVLPENDGGLVLRNLSTDLESIFGITPAATLIVIVLLSLSALFVLVAIGILCYYLARRNSFYLSEECQDGVASLFMMQISQNRSSIAKAVANQTDETVTDVPSDSTSSSDSSSGSGGCATGARGYFILPHHKIAQQKIISNSDCSKLFGEAVTAQMLELVHKIATEGMAVAFNEATGIQMAYFRDLKKTGRVAKTPLLDIDQPVYSSRFTSDSRNSGSSLNKSIAGSSQTQFRADGSAEEATSSGRRISTLPGVGTTRKKKKLDRKQSLYFAQAAVCNRPVPTQEYTFLEVEVCRASKGSQVAVGITPKIYPCFRLPGTSTGSVAYDSSGLVTFRHNNSVWFEGRASFGAGDFIGLLIKRHGDSSTEFHFYRNGRLQSFVQAPLGWKHKYHVCVGASGRAILALNFGTQAVNYPPIVSARAGYFPFGELAPMSPRNLKSDGKAVVPVTVLPVTAFALQLPVSGAVGGRTASGGYSPMDAAGGVRASGARGVYYPGGPVMETAVKAKQWQRSPQSAATTESSPATSTVDSHSIGSPVYQDQPLTPGAMKDVAKNAVALDALITEDRKKSVSTRNVPAVKDNLPGEGLERMESELSIKSADCSSVSMTPASKRP